MAKATISEKLAVEIAALSGTTIDQGLPQPAPRGDEDPRLKKIYVYADNVWTSHSVNDRRIIRVRTDAFDVTGWVDFKTHTRPQDQFITEIRITMAHASDVLLQRTGFQQQLATMDQMTGLDRISGNFIDIVIQQTFSLDNFATPVPVAYQFIVESR